MLEEFYVDLVQGKEVNTLSDGTDGDRHCDGCYTDLCYCNCEEALDMEGTDKNQSVEQLCRAAEQGDADAQNDLGHYYAFGKGVTQDDAQAVMWFRKAAEQGCADAQNNLKRLS